VHGPVDADGAGRAQCQEDEDAVAVHLSAR
jgi:hypothetical protein